MSLTETQKEMNAIILLLTFLIILVSFLIGMENVGIVSAFIILIMGFKLQISLPTKWKLVVNNSVMSIISIEIVNNIGMPTDNISLSITKFNI